MSTEKEKYRQLCDRKEIPLFMQAWWMDAVCIKGIWEVFLYEKNGEIIGAMPFHVRTKLGLKFIIQPQLTQYSGVWINYPDPCSLYKKAILEKEICTYFIERLKKYGFIYYRQNFHHSFTNWQPFYWKGFRQTTRYTFVIDDISDPEKTFLHFSDRKKRDIRNAKKTGIIVKRHTDHEDFYSFQAYCLKQKKQRNRVPKQLYASLLRSALMRNQGFILSAYQGVIQLASLLVMWDANTAYAISYAFDQQHKNSGALSLLFWEAIESLSGIATQFDFEGSMTESVAESYAQFSHNQLSFFELNYHHSPFL